MITSFVEYFDDIVAKNTEKVAVYHNDQTISFGDLKKFSVIVARSLIEEASISQNQPIAVFLTKSIDLVIANLASMYSHCPYMNLDVNTPDERINNILELVKPAAIVCEDKHVGRLKAMTDIPVLSITALKSEKPELTAIHLPYKDGVDTDPMCIINTSGSTGTPKGVVLNHRSFFDFVMWSEDEFGFNGTEVMGSLSPAVFDIYDFELCLLISKGSQMVVLDSFLASFPVRLLQVLAERKVNYIFWVPSIMVNIANMNLLSRIKLDDLRLVWFAGEVFPPKQLGYWYDMLPQAEFVNMYGPIEITLDCTFWRIKDRPDESTPVPIGLPCRNTDIIILNEEDHACKNNEEGELCVRGTSLAMGYYNNPEKTALAFTQNPLNHSYPELIYRTGDVVVRDDEGIIHFKGRRDSLIKHMGYRIELGEIEHAVINELKVSEYCCAVYDYNQKKIVLFYEGKEDIDASVFRERLSDVFPAYMIPAEYIRKELLPRNNNGKIDRLLLKNEVNNGK